MVERSYRNITVAFACQGELILWVWRRYDEWKYQNPKSPVNVRWTCIKGEVRGKMNFTYVLGPNHTQYKISLTFSYKMTFERELRPHTPLYVSFSYKSPSNWTTKQNAYKCRVPQSSSEAWKRRNDKTCLSTPLGVSYMMYATLTFSWKLSWRLPWHRTKTWFYTECGLVLRVCGVEGRGKSISGQFFFVCEKDDREKWSTKSLGGMTRPKDDMGFQIVSS